MKAVEGEGKKSQRKWEKEKRASAVEITALQDVRLDSFGLNGGWRYVNQFPNM